MPFESPDCHLGFWVTNQSEVPTNTLPGREFSTVCHTGSSLPHLSLVEASLYKHNWLSHWPVGDWAQSPTPFLSLRSGVFQPFNHVVGSPGKQLCSVLSKTPSLTNSGVVGKSFLWIFRYLWYSYQLGNFKGFKSSVPETGQKVNMYLLL